MVMSQEGVLPKGWTEECLISFDPVRFFTSVFWVLLFGLL